MIFRKVESYEKLSQLAALEIIKNLGAEIEWKNETELIIKSSFKFDKDISFSCGESGLTTRLFSGLMMLNKGQTTITGVGSLLQRPILSVFDIYRQLGIDFTSNQNFLPLVFTGNRSDRR